MEFRKLSNEIKLKDQFHIDCLESKYGFIFFPVNYEEVPNVSSLFTERPDNEIIKNVFNSLEERLLITQPIYMGTNNSVEHDKIKKQIYYNEGIDVYNWFLEHNKLSLSKLNIITNSMYILGNILNNPEISQSINMDHAIKDYSNLSFVNKFKRAKELDNQLFIFLENMYELDLIQK